MTSSSFDASSFRSVKRRAGFWKHCSLTRRIGICQRTVNTLSREQKTQLTFHTRVSHSRTPRGDRSSFSGTCSAVSAACLSTHGQWSAVPSTTRCEERDAYAEHWSLHATGTFAALSSSWDAVCADTIGVIRRRLAFSVKVTADEHDQAWLCCYPNAVRLSQPLNSMKASGGATCQRPLLTAVRPGNYHRNIVLGRTVQY